MNATAMAAITPPSRRIARTSWAGSDLSARWFPPRLRRRWRGSRPSGDLDGSLLGQLPKCRQRLGDDLVHVVVAVGREAAHEMDVRRRVGEGPVAIVERGVLRPRN